MHSSRKSTDFDLIPISHLDDKLDGLTRLELYQSEAIDRGKSLDQAEKLTQQGKYSHALEILKKIKNSFPICEYNKKMHCLMLLNQNFYNIGAIKENADEIQENFKEFVDLLEKNHHIFRKTLYYTEFMHAFYRTHLEIFLAFSNNGANKTLDEIVAYENFIWCGVEGIRINKEKKDEVDRDEFIYFLNTWGSEKYRIFSLSITSNIKTVLTWEKLIKKAIYEINPREKILLLINKAAELVDQKDCSEEALIILKKLKDNPLMIEPENEDDIYCKMLYSHLTNFSYYHLGVMNKNRDEVSDNFSCILSILQNYTLMLLKKFTPNPFVTMMNKIYFVHSKFFLDYSKDPAINLFRSTNIFKSFILCGIRGININQKQASNRKVFVDDLNKYVSKEYNIFYLPTEGPISKEKLTEWEALANSTIDAVFLDADNLYRNAIQLINIYKDYNKNAQVCLEDALKLYHARKDKDNKKLKENKIKGNILLARCYAENNSGDAIEKYQAAINQITALTSPPHDIPEVWSLYLEMGWDFLKKDNIDSAIRAFKKALKVKGYFEEDKEFFTVTSLGILQLIAEYLLDYTKKNPQPIYNESLKYYFDILDELNTKPKDQSVYVYLTEAYARVGDRSKSEIIFKKITNTVYINAVKKNLEILKEKVLEEKVVKKIVEKKADKTEKKPEFSLKKIEPKKTLAELQAEKEAEAKRAEKEKEKAEKIKEKKQKEKEERQKKLELQRLEKERQKEEEERARIKAFNEKQLEKSKGKKKKAKNKSRSDNDLLSDKALRKKERTKMKESEAAKKITKEERELMEQEKIRKEDEARAKKRAAQKKQEIDTNMEKSVKKIFIEASSDHKPIDEIKQKEVRESQKKAIQAELGRLNKETKASSKIKETTRPVSSHVDEKLIHAGIIEVALALYYKDQDVHKIIKRDKILNPLRELNKEIAPLKITFKGTSIVEGILSAEKGIHVNFDCDDIDLFIEDAPQLHIKDYKLLTKKEKEDNEKHRKLQNILEKYQFTCQNTNSHFSNYIMGDENSRTELTLRYPGYKSSDPFHFTDDASANFSKKKGLAFNNKILSKELELECDLLTKEQLGVKNYFSRLLKYYEKGQRNGFKFGKNFKKALKAEYQYTLFLGRFQQEEKMEGSSKSNYLEVQSVIARGLLGPEKVLAKTSETAKNLLKALCKAAYSYRYGKLDDEVTNIISDILITYYGQFKDKSDLALNVEFLLAKSHSITILSTDDWVLQLQKNQTREDDYKHSSVAQRRIFSPPITTNYLKGSLSTSKSSLFSPAATTDSLTPSPTSFSPGSRASSFSPGLNLSDDSENI